MIDSINKIVGFIASPFTFGLVLVVVGIVGAFLRRQALTKFFLLTALAWFCVWGTPILGDFLALPLETEYPVQLAEDVPKADAIVVMGGGIWGSTNFPYASLKEGADRAWHAARLWKAGKAPVIVTSNANAEYCDVKLLADLGVPKGAILLENKAVNTEENAKFTSDLLGKDSKFKNEGRKTKILLVTSAVHMRRSLFMFERFGENVECYPAATHYLALPKQNVPFRWRDIIPEISAFARNSSIFHEYIGYYGYKWFR